MILQPQVAFPIVRQIANHTDLTTYYVRAVVRNASGTTIDTVDLASQGNQRYQTSWQVPADPSGQGSYISIVTSVYTDSGYTTKSENYGDEENTYLVFDRVMPAMRGGAGGGIDSRTVRRIIQEELAKLPPPEKMEFPDIPMYEMRWDDIISEVQNVQKIIALLPKPEKTDVTPVLDGISRVEKAIQNKEVTPATDLSPILEKMTEEKEDRDISHDEMRSMLKEMEQRVSKNVPDSVIKRMENMTFDAKTIKMEAKEEKDYRIDLSKLTA